MKYCRFAFSKITEGKKRHINKSILNGEFFSAFLFFFWEIPRGDNNFYDFSRFGNFLHSFHRFLTIKKVSFIFEILLASARVLCAWLVQDSRFGVLI